MLLVWRRLVVVVAVVAVAAAAVVVAAVVVAAVVVAVVVAVVDTRFAPQNSRDVFFAGNSFAPPATVL